MMRSFPSLLVGFSLALAMPVWAQTADPALPASPSSTPPSVAQAIPQAPAGTGQVTTIRTRSNLVVLDVVVTDRNHKPVHGLKAGDFQVKEAGVAQTVKSVEEHTPAAMAPTTAKMAPLPPGVFTNFTLVPDNGPINVLLIDKLNTPLESQPYLRQQLTQFVKTMKPGTRVAIFGLNRQLVYLQGFTSDPKVLLAALESKKNSASQSAIKDTSASFKGSDELFQANMAAGNPTGVAAEAIADIQQFEAQNQSFQLQLRVKYTMEAMNVLARYLSALPGRKNLIWFSGSFPLSVLPDPDLKYPFMATTDMTDQFRATTGLLTKAQVAVYPIDARGLSKSDTMDASQNNVRLAMDTRALTKTLTEDSTRGAEERTTMLQMAEATGGVASVNTNALAEAVEKSIDNGSSYYTISYTPSEVKNDGSFRKIQVATTPGGYGLAYRRGYYADTAKKERTQLTASAAAPTLTPQQVEVRNSMMRGAPTPSEIVFKVFVGPEGLATDPVVAEGNAPSEAAKGPYRKYTVNYAASPADIGFKNVGPGKYEISLQFVIYVYDADGQRLNTIGNAIHATVTPAIVKGMLDTGVQFHQTVSVPAKGNYFLRIGVHDMLTDHVGSVEVPVDAVKDLAIVEAPKPKPAAAVMSDLPK